ncbi:hypothetical protein [Vibrio tasmaniensis]|uniref:hypothetical protein n=1 Tax=Vibrio tasmaniensis TaxID=212663 RepID=UPI00111A2296|nr:hypothetical protein [Vibrio tasmaniensis]
MYFGLACEGTTDQIVLETVICGYFDDEDLDDEIHQFQPPFDESKRKQAGFGGWELLLEYLRSTRFRDDALNCNYMVVHVDTDISKNIGFDVPHVNERNEEITVDLLTENVINRLTQEINSGKAGFYDEHSEKIIFCIAVHSIECWLNAYYDTKKLNNPKIKNCEKGLRYILVNKHSYKDREIVKDYDFYKILSEPLLDNRVLEKLKAKDPSLSHFVGQLDAIEAP